MRDLIKIGKIVSVFGLNGELVLKHALGKKTTFKSNHVLFIEVVKSSYLPYFVISARSKNQEETFLKLEMVDTREKALKLLQKNVWLEQVEFRKLVDKNAAISLLGYSLINDSRDLGKIVEVIEQPHQVLLQLRIDEKDVFIPLHEETLIKLDHIKNEVHVRLPEGLLDIYLQ